MFLDEALFVSTELAVDMELGILASSSGAAAPAIDDDVAAMVIEWRGYYYYDVIKLIDCSLFMVTG